MSGGNGGVAWIPWGLPQCTGCSPFCDANGSLEKWAWRLGALPVPAQALGLKTWALPPGENRYEHDPPFPSPLSRASVCHLISTMCVCYPKRFSALWEFFEKCLHFTYFSWKAS